jgi:hypothetical protein
MGITMVKTRTTTTATDTVTTMTMETGMTMTGTEASLGPRNNTSDGTPPELPNYFN